MLFKAPSGERSQAQIEAFGDTWHWNEPAERAVDEVVTEPHSDASIMLKAMRSSALGDNDMMAYLAMMAVRLIELHRVLTGAPRTAITTCRSRRICSEQTFVATRPNQVWLADVIYVPTAKGGLYLAVVLDSAPR